MRKPPWDTPSSAKIHGKNKSFKIKAPKLGTWECWSKGAIRWEGKRSLAASTYVKQQGSSSVSDWGSGPTWAPRCFLKHINHPKQGHHGYAARRDTHTHTHTQTHNKAGWRARVQTQTLTILYSLSLASIWCIQRLIPSSMYACTNSHRHTHTHTETHRQARKVTPSHTQSAPKSV